MQECRQKNREWMAKTARKNRLRKKITAPVTRSSPKFRERAVQRIPTNRRIPAKMQKIQALTEIGISKSICRPSEKTVTLIIMVQKQPERKMAKPMRMVMAKCRMRTVKSPGLTKTGRL